MAEDPRNDDSVAGELDAKRSALIRACTEEEENCLYTSTTFLVWLRWLRGLRAFMWAAAAISGAVAANHILKSDPSNKVIMALAALGGVLFPGIVKALRLDDTINNYTAAAATYKVLQYEFRRAATVWSKKNFSEFEQQAKSLFSQINEVRKLSLTPPELCFRIARRKIKKGHYKFDSVDQNGRE